MMYRLENRIEKLISMGAKVTRIFTTAGLHKIIYVEFDNVNIIDHRFTTEFKTIEALYYLKNKYLQGDIK